ncbi:endo alpha-1,4 polygalactosaminidase [Pengzhenrongella sicca]|uniref:Endo alpha-1,4 polygalactosaminidase n=1 Tax=Pengzhenrongella sicca TaxID=2819238 RepID=A0A8A4ZJG8_9MICO|nr:endo alpha-1,4 polygalactosaminidase [Pengzhenrongella sicca]
MHERSPRRRRPVGRLGALGALAVLAAPVSGCGAAAPTRWVPPAQVSWQWQLSGDLDLTVPADVYDVDLFTTTERQVAQLHAAGRKVICYVSAGSYEPDRPDSA